MNYFIQFLTYFRILIAPIIFILITLFDFYGWALLLFFIASISDYWDGFLARKYNLESMLGAVLDPIADKILLTFLILALSIELYSPYVAFLGGIIIAFLTIKYFLLFVEKIGVAPFIVYRLALGLILIII